MSNDIEQEIQAKGLTAPRVTPTDIEAAIMCQYFFTAEEAVQGRAPSHDSMKLLTFCVLVLNNGFTVTGESACASPENFDADLGRRIARQNAVNKIWPLLGYELKTKLKHEAWVQEQTAKRDAKISQNDQADLDTIEKLNTSKPAPTPISPPPYEEDQDFSI